MLIYVIKMDWKYKDQEPVFYRIGISVYHGTVQYTDSLPSITDEGEECYHIRPNGGGSVLTCACSLYRDKDDAIKDALAEIHRKYWRWVRLYFQAIEALERL